MTFYHRIVFDVFLTYGCFQVTYVTLCICGFLFTVLLLLTNVLILSEK